ncbi:MAG: acetylxylan esterase [Opitutaceae bacterium]
MSSRTLLSLLPIVFMFAGTSLRGADVRADFLKLIDRPRVPLAAATLEASAPSGLTRIDFNYASDATNRVPGYLLKTALTPKSPRPVIIVLHGTGGSKESELPYLTELAHAGFIAVAIDGRYHGARSRSGKGSADYIEAILRAFRLGTEHPFFYDTAWDVMRLIDYLVTRPDVDPTRIGLFGISKGGIETYLTAAADPRVAVAVPCIAVESFHWAVDNNSWQSRIGTVQFAFDAAAKDSGLTSPGADFVHTFYTRVAPGLDREFDGPAMVPLIAPRPLLAINGEIDPRTPMAGLKLCSDAAQLAYHAAQADEKFSLLIQRGIGHKVTPEAYHQASEWFVHWLKP